MGSMSRSGLAESKTHAISSRREAAALRKLQSRACPKRQGQGSGDRALGGSQTTPHVHELALICLMLLHHAQSRRRAKLPMSQAAGRERGKACELTGTRASGAL